MPGESGRDRPPSTACGQGERAFVWRRIWRACWRAKLAELVGIGEVVPRVCEREPPLRADETLKQRKCP